MKPGRYRPKLGRGRERAVIPHSSPLPPASRRIGHARGTAPSHSPPRLPSRLPSTHTYVERARALASRWSAQLDERPGRQGPCLLGLPGSMADGMGVPRPSHPRAAPAYGAPPSRSRSAPAGGMSVTVEPAALGARLMPYPAAPPRQPAQPSHTTPKHRSERPASLPPLSPGEDLARNRPGSRVAGMIAERGPPTVRRLKAKLLRQSSDWDSWYAGLEPTPGQSFRAVAYARRSSYGLLISSAPLRRLRRLRRVDARPVPRAPARRGAGSDLEPGNLTPDVHCGLGGPDCGDHQGPPEKVAQRILRHAQIAMAMEVYAEASGEEVWAAIGMLSEAMGGGSGG